MTLERLKADLAHAKKKAAEWSARARDIEKQIVEKENTEILQAVRSIAATPEELHALLNQIKAAQAPPTVKQEEHKLEN